MGKYKITQYGEIRNHSTWGNTLYLTFAFTLCHSLSLSFQLFQRCEKWYGKRFNDGKYTILTLIFIKDIWLLFKIYFCDMTIMMELHITSSSALVGGSKSSFVIELTSLSWSKLLSYNYHNLQIIQNFSNLMVDFSFLKIANFLQFCGWSGRVPQQRPPVVFFLGLLSPAFHTWWWFENVRQAFVSKEI